MGAPENLTRAAVERMLTAASAVSTLAWWSVTPGSGMAGFPDFVACVAGGFVGIECKADPADGGRGPSPQQLKTIEKIRAADGDALVVRDAESFRQLHYHLQLGLRCEFKAPEWRSKQVLNRRKPPPLKEKA